MITAALVAFSRLSLRTKVESAVVVLAVAGAGLWWFMRPPAPAPEVITAAPMVRQTDQSVIAERAFAPKPAPPPHAIPAGYAEQRRESVHVAFDTPKKEAEIDLSFVTKGDEVRAIASSPDGKVTYATDSIIIPRMMPPSPRMSAIGVGYATDGSVGFWAEHDIGRVRFGAEVSKGSGKPRAELRLGFAF